MAQKRLVFFIGTESLILCFQYNLEFPIPERMNRFKRLGIKKENVALQ